MKLGVDVPDRWRPLIEKAMEIEGWETYSAYIKELIKKDLVAKGLLGVVKNDEQKEAEAIA